MDGGGVVACHAGDGNIIGQRFGKRVVLEDAGRRRYRRMVTVRCDCGSVDAVYIGSLMQGQANQCGDCRCRVAREAYSRFIKLGHITKTVADWSRESGIDRTTIQHRLNRRGWSPLAAVFGDSKRRVPESVLERLGLVGDEVIRR